ncbi:MAG: 4'-phosphopantetheinyl transferase superfamily protein [Bacteroidetes bacterium]|nr:4'-phosphopantetheinyl transferase superfamily protein [Bacteroidota bacterium]
MILITAISLTELRNSEVSATELLKLIPEKSRVKLEKITNPDSNARSLLGELLARYSIIKYSGIGSADIHFGEGEKGKPYMPDHPEIHFNITHSAEMVACAVAGTEIGIDIEHYRKVNFRVAERFFSAAEYEDLFALEESQRQDYFFTLWTLKESFLKAIGSGLTRNLNSFTVVKTSGGYRLEGDDLSASFTVGTYMLPGHYHFAVCSPEQFLPQHVQMVSIPEILELLVFSE